MYRQETQRHRMAVAPAWAPRSSQPLLVLLLLLLLGMSPCSSMVAQDRRAAALSLHPPYFNLAQAARIWATATCGERGPEVSRPRPELYCKLVGGPTAQGSGHTIQVWSPRVAGIGSKFVTSSSTWASHWGQRTDLLFLTRANDLKWWGPDSPKARLAGDTVTWAPSSWYEPGGATPWSHAILGGEGKARVSERYGQVPACRGSSRLHSKISITQTAPGQHGTDPGL